MIFLQSILESHIVIKDEGKTEKLFTNPHKGLILEVSALELILDMVSSSFMDKVATPHYRCFAAG